MRVTLHFSPGQTVWMVGEPLPTQPLVRCAACEGRGKVTLAAGKEYTCPACYGKGNLREFGPLQRQAEAVTVVQAVIGREMTAYVVENARGVWATYPRDYLYANEEDAAREGRRLDEEDAR